MKLKIDFNIAPNELATTWPSFFTIGSCFATSQAKQMKELGFDTFSNPFGILYNPVSIERILDRSIHKSLYKPEEFEHKGSFFSWEHHGDYKYSTAAEALASSNKILQCTSEKLSTADTIIITYGTSLVYTYNNEVVGNCHKVPNKEFDQRQLTFDEVKQSIQHTLNLIKTHNPAIHIIFTVSPIRHLRSGVQESSQSKAVILSALHEAIAENSNVSYFPSYEIFIDELRDYRFAKTDMTHPTEQAENYIWKRFCETYFSAETNNIIGDVNKYNQLAAHRPIHDASLHLQQVADKLKILKTNYPFLSLE